MTSEFESTDKNAPTRESAEWQLQFEEWQNRKKVQENFFDNNFPKLRSDIKKRLEDNVCNLFASGEASENYKEDLLNTYLELDTIIDPVFDQSKKSVYYHNLRVGYAFEKYVLLTSKWEGGFLFGTNFNRIEFTRVFLDSYRHLESKEAGKFVNELIESYKTDLLDSHFWDLVEGIKKQSTSKEVGYFARALYRLSQINLGLTTWGFKKNEMVPFQNSFAINFNKVKKNAGFKNAKAFSLGMEQLLFAGKDNFDQYASFAIDISRQVPGEMGYWAIYDTALLERDDIDFGAYQFINDILDIKNTFGEKASWTYMMGMVGAIKNKPTKTVSDLSKSLLLIEKKLNDLGWYYEEKEKIGRSEDDQYRKEMLIRYLDENIDSAKKNLDFIIPQKIEDYPKIDPLIFRAMFKDILANFGMSEAYLFANFWKNGFLYYYDGKESDFKAILGFPKLLEEFKGSVSEKVYKKAIFAIGKMANLGTRTNIKLIKDVMECYANIGEKITLGRINYTYGLYYLRGGYKMGYLGGIDGLEKTEGDVYKRRKTQKNEDSTSS